MQKKDLYGELGLKKSCDADEIRKSYKKLALQWHPDKNRDNIEAATLKFQQISEAYAILSDEKKRAHYDRFGFIDEGDFDFNDFMNDFDFDDFFGAMMFDMNMMFDMMDIAMKPGRLNGRRMKNMEKKMAKKYEQQMFDKFSKQAFGGMGGMGGFPGMGDFGGMGGFGDMDFGGMGGFGDPFGFKGKGKKKPTKKSKEEEDDGWETEEEETDEEDKGVKGTIKNGKGEEEDNSDDYEDVDDDDEDEDEVEDEKPKKIYVRKENGKSTAHKEEEHDHDDDNDDDEDEREKQMYEELQEHFLKEIYEANASGKDIESWIKDMVGASEKIDEDVLKKVAGDKSK